MKADKNYLQKYTMSVGHHILQEPMLGVNVTVVSSCNFLPPGILGDVPIKSPFLHFAKMLFNFSAFDTENLIRDGTFPVCCVTGKRRSDRDVCAVKCHHTVNASVICCYATSCTAHYDIFHYILRGNRRVCFDGNTISGIKLGASIGCSAAIFRCMVACHVITLPSRLHTRRLATLPSSL